MSLAQSLADVQELAERAGRPVQVMEVCGTHTMAAFRSGLRPLLPDSVRLLSGPGCPVCVTPNAYVDQAIAIAQQPGTLVTTFGDMLRVPGSYSSLEKARAAGAAVRVVYSPLDALRMARETPATTVVFLGIGFETTAPTVGWTVQEAARSGVANYAVLCAHKTMPHAMAGLLASGEVKVDGFLCPGHVSVITGARIYEFICREYHIPCVVTGFEPADMAAGIEQILRQIVVGHAEVGIQYSRSVTLDGNRAAQALLADVFEECDAAWRGLGVIPRSGLRIREPYAAHDAARRFADVPVPPPVEPRGCICGAVLRGVKTPLACPLFRTRCTPATPVGACMVSSEGTCAAYYRYALSAAGAGGAA